VVVGEQLRVETFPQPPDQGRRALNVGEQERESLHGQSLGGQPKSATGHQVRAHRHSRLRLRQLSRAHRADPPPCAVPCPWPLSSNRGDCTHELANPRATKHRAARSGQAPGPEHNWNTAQTARGPGTRNHPARRPMRSDPGHLGTVAHIADTVRRRHQIGREESHCQPFRLTVRDRPWTRAESAQSRLMGGLAARHVGVAIRPERSLWPMVGWNVARGPHRRSAAVADMRRAHQHDAADRRAGPVLTVPWVAVRIAQVFGVRLGSVFRSAPAHSGELRVLGGKAVTGDRRSR